MLHPLLKYGYLKTDIEKLKWYWNMGGELVTRKAEERWGSGVVEQVSLDLQAEFPDSKGLSADNPMGYETVVFFLCREMSG